MNTTSAIIVNDDVDSIFLQKDVQYTFVLTLIIILNYDKQILWHDLGALIVSYKFKNTTIPCLLFVPAA
jgi:hypothetical protein